MSSVLNLRLKSLPWLNTDERGDVYEKLVANIIQTQPPYDDGKDLAEQTTSDDLKDWDVGNATSCDNGRVSSSQSTSAQPTTFTPQPQSAILKLFGLRLMYTAHRESSQS